MEGSERPDSPGHPYKPHRLSGLVTDAGPGFILYGGARMALLDVESGFWAIRRQLEALVGRSLADGLLQQAGANGGASFARSLLETSGLDSADGRRVFDECLAAYEAAGFGRFEVVAARWPAGRGPSRIVVRGTDTIESWMCRRHEQTVASPVCSYTAGVLVGFVNTILGGLAAGREVVCVERMCQARGARECVFEILPAANVFDARPIAVDPDPALSHQLNLLHIFFERMPMGVAIFDEHLILRRCNPTWADFVTRYSRASAGRVVPGARLWELVPGGRTHLEPLVARALDGQSVREEGVPVDAGGITTYWDVAFVPLVRDGRVSGVMEVTVDATDRVVAYRDLAERVEQRTREIEQRRAVAEGLRDILAVLNSDRPLGEVLDYIVGQAGRFLGTDTVALYRLDPESQLLTIQTSTGLPEGYAERARIPAGQGAIGMATVRREPVAFSGDDLYRPVFDPELGSESLAFLDTFRDAWASILAVPLIVGGEVYGGIALFYPERRVFLPEDYDLATAFGNQVALAVENAALRSQAAQAAVAAERNRLARDLHDSVTQTLFSASLIADVLPRIWDRHPDQGRARLEELRQLTRGALAEMRMLLLELRPAALVETGLPDLLRQLGEAVTGRARVPVELQVSGERTLSQPVKVALYRIAQEALNNVAKHSGAGRAWISLNLTPDGAELHVRDDGRGFDPAAVGHDRLGLGIMRERAADVGAAIDITAATGHGAEVRVVWKG